MVLMCLLWLPCLAYLVGMYKQYGRFAISYWTMWVGTISSISLVLSVLSSLVREKDDDKNL